MSKRLSSCRLCLVLVTAAIFASPVYSEEEIRDPFEGFNRRVFQFNDGFDVYVAEPVAEAYDSVVPDPVQDGISNFFANLRNPSYFVSDLVQFKFEQAGVHTARFVINSTLGIAGFLDVAQHLGLEEHKEDFALALAYHGVPAGPYLVLPLLGPSTLRDGIGLIVDTVLDPIYILTFGNVLRSKEETILGFGAKTVEFVNRRADLLDAVDTAKESALDYYLFVQSAYYQHREGLLNDGVSLDDDEDWDLD